MTSIYYTKTKSQIDLFWCRGNPFDVDLTRIYGSKFRGRKWIFPAFSPFIYWVLEDLETIFGDKLELQPCAKAHIAASEKDHSLVEQSHDWGFTPKFKPYTHQAQGLSRIIYQPRCAIFWDPGMGKTKLICDRILYERERNPNSLALILALRVNLSTWQREMGIHSEGQEQIVPLVAGSPAQRKKKLES